MNIFNYRISTWVLLIVFMLVIALYPEYFTLSDIISVIGIFFAILGYYEAKQAAQNAKSAEESANEAVNIAKQKAKDYSDHLSLHACQRLVILMEKTRSIENKKDKKDLCDFIQVEIINIRKGIKKISNEQKTFLQSFTSFLEIYKCEEEKQDTLERYIYKFKELISELIHTEEIYDV